jgi:hypothetical protein
MAGNCSDHDGFTWIISLQALCPCIFFKYEISVDGCYGDNQVWVAIGSVLPLGLFTSD